MPENTARIRVVGLGPGSKDYISLRAWQELSSSSKLILRTERHPIVAELKRSGIEYESCDRFYDNASCFDEVYDSIVAYLQELAQHYQLIHYAVPGHPLVLERTVEQLIKISDERLEVEIVPSMSGLEMIYARLGINPAEGVLIVDALSLTETQITSGQALLVTQVYSQLVASDVKLALLEVYPPEHEVTIVTAAGVAGEEQIFTQPLFELDRQDFSHLSSVFVPPYVGRPIKPIEKLLDIVAQLRGKNGCPWDREQTHKSLRPYLLEETYEVLEALEAEDRYKLCEELGDLLLQIVFHAQIAKEEQEFDFYDVVEALNQKMIRRHPHVFGDITVSSASQALVNWEKVKDRERQGETPSTSVLDSVPRVMPALMQAEKLQSKAAKLGFDWADIAGAWDKLLEELEELRQARAEGEKEKISAELGDVLFAVVNVARFLEVPAEVALLSTVEKFRWRFSYIERKLRSLGLQFEDVSLEEMDKWWEEAKNFG